MAGRKETRAEQAVSPQVGRPAKLDVVARPVNTYVGPQQIDRSGFALLQQSLVRGSNRIEGQALQFFDKEVAKQVKEANAEFELYKAETNGRPSLEGFQAWRTDSDRQKWMGNSVRSAIQDSVGATISNEVNLSIEAQIKEDTFKIYGENGEVSLANATAAEIVDSLERAQMQGITGMSNAALAGYSATAAGYTQSLQRMLLDKKEAAVKNEYLVTTGSETGSQIESDLQIPGNRDSQRAITGDLNFRFEQTEKSLGRDAAIDQAFNVTDLSAVKHAAAGQADDCLLYTSPSPRDA